MQKNKNKTKITKCISGMQEKNKKQIKNKKTKNK